MASVDYVDDTQLGIMYSGCVSRYICLPSCWNVLYMIYIKLKFLKRYFSLCAQLMMWFWWARGFSHSKLSCFGDSAFSSKLHGRALYHDLQQEELRSLWRAVLKRARDVLRTALIDSLVYYLYSWWVPGKIKQCMEIWLSPLYSE